MPPGTRIAALVGAAAALPVVAAVGLAAGAEPVEGARRAVGLILLLAGAIALFLLPVVLQVREAMGALRRLRPPALPVLAVTAAFVVAASVVFAVAVTIGGVVRDGPILIDGERPSELVALLWWWPLAVSAGLVVAGAEVAARLVRRSVASRRHRGGGGNGAG